MGREGQERIRVEASAPTIGKKNHQDGREDDAPKVVEHQLRSSRNQGRGGHKTSASLYEFPFRLRKLVFILCHGPRFLYVPPRRSVLIAHVFRPRAPKAQENHAKHERTGLNYARVAQSETGGGTVYDTRTPHTHTYTQEPPCSCFRISNFAPSMNVI